MTRPRTSAVRRRRAVTLASTACLALTVTGCTWDGVNSLPLPGTPGRGEGSYTFTVEMADVGTLESNSPVMIDDVVVGSVGRMVVDGWHADIEVSVERDVTVPANVVATIGQTSLLGSSHLALNPPAGFPPEGRLVPGATIGLDRSSTYPSTERTLAAAAVVLNRGGLGQIGDIVTNLNDALGGREDAVRDLLTRLDTFVGTLDTQRADIVETIDGLNRLAGTVSGQRDVVADVLDRLPAALEVLLQERPAFTTALDRLRTFSDTATAVVTDTRQDLVTNLEHLEPTLRALADVGTDLDKALAYATVYPYGQSVIDRAVRGDYLNLFATVDLTVPRLQRELLLGTPWGDPNAVVQAAVGDPGYAQPTRDPLGAGVGGTR
ncbi:MCE family protein [Rhodococcus phenolicus]|uniref:MCE family protein n=1 Tax=Rhodococcus phenolicus TaxID=263849 RepID=UPI000836AFA6|nr:MCE family protein [Rhodococcus phenolicus]